MKRGVPIALAAAVLILRGSSAGTAAEMKEMNFDRSNLRGLQTRFSTYGYRPPQSIRWEADGLRFRLPAGVAGVSQTGLYSYFALAGDCEATLTYELLQVQPPRQGYGSGVGLAFDTGDESTRGLIQRVHKGAEGSGYVLQSRLPGARGEVQDQYRFVPTPTKRGRISLRRVKKELIFLASDAPAAPLQEVDRLPFTDRTVRVVRFFADAGGSPTAVDVRVTEIGVRAEEIAGGVPEMERTTSKWWWLWVVVPAAGVGLLYRLWRAHRRRCDDQVLH